jgi:Ca2+-binding RTX toxin-like protein
VSRRQLACLLAALAGPVLVTHGLADGGQALSCPPSGCGPLCGGYPATIVGTGGRDRLIGTRRRDVIVARAGDDRIWGKDGGDLVCAGTGDDFVEGNSGNDGQLRGLTRIAPVPAGLYGGAGRDVLRGGSGNDDVLGARGADFLYGGPGPKDICKGGSPNSSRGPDIADPSCEWMRGVEAELLR